jgi:uncharacterized membrane protein YeaQ/YmgE (transglycosylase-associated protein family)
MSGQPDDDLVPVSVRLGEVVPPEDPEDWTQPLTWMAALGMLLGPLVAFAWFLVAPPADDRIGVGTFVLAVALVTGAVLTGATQQGWLRAATATVASALFAALVTIVVGAALAGERQLGFASPTVAHAFGATLAGLAGALVASPLAARFAGAGSRWPRLLTPAAVGSGVALLLLPFLFGTAAPT